MENKFGRLIRARRHALGLTLMEAARESGLHYTYLCAVERGHVTPPSQPATARLAKTMRIHPATLKVMAWLEKSPREIQATALYRRLAGEVAKMRLYT